MLNYPLLTQQQYENLVVNLISSAEGQIPTVIDIGDGKATIGYGYTFDGRSNNLALWQAANISLTPAQVTELQNIDAAPTAQIRHALALKFDRSISKPEAIALLRQTYTQYEGP